MRKDGGLSIPRKVDEGPITKEETTTTYIDLVRPEFTLALITLAVILIFSMLIPAPLEPLANPDVSPNPAKAPWYFLGIQELLLHYHPLIGTIVIPLLALIALVRAALHCDRYGQCGHLFPIAARALAGACSAPRSASLLTIGYVLLDEFCARSAGAAAESAHADLERSRAAGRAAAGLDRATTNSIGACLQSHQR